MPGEERGNKGLTKCFVPKPDARVRLFILYGVADVSMSTEPWIRSAPDWLECRLIDLPGHGFRSKESLPPCATTNANGLDESKLTNERQALVDQLTDEIITAAEGKPFALYGFSFGALLMYGVSLSLQKRGATNQPICLCVAGRGAPHCMAISRSSA